MDSDVAPANSLKGRLQRGRGPGYLDALSAPSEEARAALLDCIVRDPRWDSQVESRSPYYAELAQSLALRTSELAVHLFNSDDDNLRDEDRTGLTLAVLQELGRRGRHDAVATLRRYAVEGWNWQWALESLAALDFPQATEGLGDAIERRFENDGALIEALRGATTPELWSRWAETNPRLRKALSAISAERASVDDSYRAEPQPLAALVKAATSGPEDARRTALVNLGNLRAAEAVEPAELAIRNGSTELRRLGRRALFRAANPGMTPRARRWANEDNDLAEVALHVLARYGERSDLDFLRNALESAWRQGHMYAACDAVEGLGRLADNESEPIVQAIYDETTYSHLRRGAARALAALSPDFALGRAVESMWDCESETRAVGVASANLALGSVRDRLDEIVNDPLEGASILSLAQARRHLGAAHPSLPAESTSQWGSQ
jgi:hypothetical protein